MDQPALASAVPREDLGHTESLVTTSKQTRKNSALEREGWWRITLTNTPIPGTYHLKTFIEESLLNPVKATYNFKNEGRKRLPLVQRNDPVLMDLPQYKPPDFLDLLKKQMASYSFRDQPRPNPSTLVDKDEGWPKTGCERKHRTWALGKAENFKRANGFGLSRGLVTSAFPGQYEILPAPVPRTTARSFVFRSAVQRFPPNYFTPREGPGPGEYSLKTPPVGSITSCFRSKVPRFLPSCSKTPGPGAYTTSKQFPKQSATIAKMGRRT